MESRAAASRELLLAALEDLSQEQLKRFRHKLRHAPLDGRSIPWGRLECADAVDLAEQLTQFYGPEPALDVARKTLKKADVRDVAERLKEQRLQRERGAPGRPGPCPSVPSRLGPRARIPGAPEGVPGLLLRPCPAPAARPHVGSPSQGSAPAPPRRSSPCPVGLSVGGAGPEPSGAVSPRLGA